MTYVKQTWLNGAAGHTPITADRLNHIESGIANGQSYDTQIFLDAQVGADDDAKLTAAIAAQKAASKMPPIVLPNRTITFNIPRALYSGLKIIGLSRTGQKNGELADGRYVGAEVVLGGSIGSGTSSWWVTPGGDIYDVYMADFSVQGSQGSSVHQFIDVTSGTLYAAEFHALSFNFMRGVFGRADRKCLMTQVALTGSWTMNNAWDTQMFVGGSDNVFFMDSFNNVGTSTSPAQSGNLSRWFFKFDWIEAQLGKCYISTQNGWRGLLISGSSSSVDLHGSIFEGDKPTRVDGLRAGPGPGCQVKVTGGAVSMHGVKIGQGMDNPDPSEDGLLQIEGGEVSLFGPTFYGRNMGTPVGGATRRAAIKHTGGRLAVVGALKRQDESSYWSGRPTIKTTAATGSGSYTYYCPDLSVARF